MEQAPNVVIAIAIFVIGCAVYFLPSLIARDKRHRNFGAILALNLFLGWTGLGWFAALIWSLTNDPPTPRIVIERRN